MNDYSRVEELEKRIEMMQGVIDRATEREYDDDRRQRDRFAAAALTGWIKALADRRKEPGYDDKSACYEAARLAGITSDAMMEERKRRDEKKGEK
jgi:hypothetical protein